MGITVFAHLEGGKRGCVQGARGGHHSVTVCLIGCKLHSGGQRWSYGSAKRDHMCSHHCATIIAHMMGGVRLGFEGTGVFTGGVY
eukprot:717710-Prorocentrum_minimum.AAC.1